MLYLFVLDFDIPKIQQFSFPDNVVEGNLASVHCLAITKSKPIEFVWLKNGIKIDARDNVRIHTSEEVSTLIVDPVKITDGGNYTCSAKNHHGSDKFAAFLHVKGKNFYENYRQLCMKLFK